MKKVFIAYGDEMMKYSLKRIGCQAQKIGLFDEIILWTPEKLPDYIKQSPLIYNKRGGGYWVWKPIIIYETLQRYEEGTYVVYIDAGCTLKKGAEWHLLLRLLENYDTICFQYAPYMKHWEQFGQGATAIKYWTKKECLDFLSEELKTKDFHDYSKIWGGAFLCKNKENSFIKKWRQLTLEYPELLKEPTENELKNQYDGFALHRHDQCIITALSYCDSSVFVLPEFMENSGEDSIIYASRIRAKDYKSYLILRFKYYLRKYLGEVLYDKMKKYFR